MAMAPPSDQGWRSVDPWKQAYESQVGDQIQCRVRFMHFEWLCALDATSE